MTTFTSLASTSKARKLGALERAVQACRLLLNVVSSLLFMRFLLLALGANQENAFASLILALSYPFAAPFLTLFGTNPSAGNSVLQFPLLVAVVVYLLVGLLATRALRLIFAPTDPSGAAYRDR